MQLLQGGLELQRQAAGSRQFLGKPRTTLQRRADHRSPAFIGPHRSSQLCPASLGQCIVEAAAQTTALLRFAVAQEVQDHAGRSATAASAKVAMPLCSAQARRSIGTTSAAPLPSPRRSPRLTIGVACKAASRR